MNNLTQHFSHQPILLILLAASLLLLVISVPYFVKQGRLYGSFFDYASRSKKVIAGLSLITIVGISLYGLTPYAAPAAKEIVIVLGNTQNTPSPQASEYITKAIEDTLLQHKGDEASTLTDSIRIISAVKHPEVINLDASELRLRKIGNNGSNAKRAAKANAEAIVAKMNSLTPSESGANYLEAIFEAKNNVEEGSRIIVVGSGLSDDGELSFSKTNILTKEENRKSVIREIGKEYKYDYLDGYAITFFGLGDTVAPQEPLSNKQKQIVRDVYQGVVSSIGGDVDIDTRTLVGDAVKTDYIVGTTDTGCGDIGLVFDDENLKFVSNQAVFKNPVAAKNSLASIKTLWDSYGDTIQLIQVDGYIAHYAGPDNLSQQRADLVKGVLLELGVPAATLNATGRGFGPYQQDLQNRIVKVTISRNSDQCSN